MKGAVALFAASAALANAGKLPPVTVKGNAFFAGNDRFYVRGLDYQPGGSSKASDPIADANGCKRDVAEFKKLGINTIRVYTVDNTADHDECMSALEDAGIYLALDVNSPKYSLNRADPSVSYNSMYLQSVFATIDAFAKYDNTLLFFSGNEVINSDKTTDCAPYIKAVTRDMKQYLGTRGYRKIPVGYSAADVESNRFEMASYMNCGTDDQRSDFFAFNDYSWCDPSSFQQSGWDQKVKQYGDYSIPLFLSEYGCITNKRQFQEVHALYSNEMTAVYSGGLVYEYSEEGNGYGLVKISGNQVTEMSDFTALQNALSAQKPPSGDGGYKSNGQPSKCPSQSNTWEVKDFTGEALPAMPNGAEKYMQKGAGKGPGLTGDGSQEAGAGSTGTASAGSGTVTSTASPSSSSGAANAVRPGETSMAPFVISGVVILCTLLGATLL
ncbi:glycoside hydrolase family 72 [Lecanosticta acicola]|uniref:1,3-beta-glucanosyltransferase n=1 Tax=Lecanosticta acicola TaxID=111012 RepID=A0AAI9EFR3_9PEZI|nr:glycoside hydrolase family 72 [Lecanosticta acicola]